MRGLTLVTANAGEFQRVAGLTIEDWSQEWPPSEPDFDPFEPDPIPDFDFDPTHDA